MQLSLRNKLLVLFLALGVGPMMTIGVVSYFNSVGSVEQVLVDQIRQGAAGMAVEVENRLEAGQDQIRLLAGRREIQDLYAWHTAIGPDAAPSMEGAVQALFDRLGGGQGVIVRLLCADLQGRQVWRHGGEAIGLDPTQYAGQERIAATNVYSPADGPLVRVGCWVENSAGEKQGFLVADLAVERLLQSVRADENIDASRNIIVVDDEQGRLLYHAHGGRVGQPLQRALPALYAVYEQVKSEEEGWSRFADRDGKWLVAFIGIDQLNWTLGVLDRPSMFTGLVQRAGFYNLAITLISVLLIALFIPLVIARITASIQLVARGAEAIAAGDLDQVIEVRTHDRETRTLAQSFNRMARSLKATLGDLQDLTEELEDRVGQRTAELEAATRSVQLHNEHLVQERGAQQVRAEALSMRSTQDLRKLVAVIWREMDHLGMNPTVCAIVFIDRQANRAIDYFALENPRKNGFSWTSSDFVEIDPDVAVGVRVLPPDQDMMVRRLAGGQVAAWSPDREEVETLKLDVMERFGFTQPLPFTTVNMYCTCVPFTYGIIGVRAPVLAPEYADVLRDFTEGLDLGYLRFLDFRRLEEQNQALEEANRQIQAATRHKSAFLARMSHDLRTPMNAIIGYTRILRRRTREILDERQYRNLENIQLSADNLLVLINDILDLSRIEAGRTDLQIALVDIPLVMRECAAAVDPLLAPDVQLYLDLEDMGPFRSDRDLIRRVAMNLLGNAVKFTQSGRIGLRLRSAAVGIELEFADTGQGIPANELPHLFEEFHQVPRQGNVQEGSGLGLAIVHKTVDLLGGRIAVESALGQGTTFTVYLPYFSEE